MVAEVGVVLGTLTYPHLILPYSAYSCIATAEQVSLKGALAAEKRRANKLQRQIERASRSQTAKAGVDASLAGALELQETLEAERGRSRSLERRLEDMQRGGRPGVNSEYARTWNDLPYESRR